MKFAGNRWTDLHRTPQKWIDMKDLDLAKAHIVQRSGRDVVALETNQDGFVLYLCDSPNGGENYSVTIAIPPK